MPNNYTPEDLQAVSQYNFAESANQKPEVWVANTYALLNRLNSGKYGDTIPEVIQGMSSAVRTNSPQYQIASGQKPMNQVEENAMKHIISTTGAVLRGNIDNPIGDATHFENVEKFGKPSWAKNMKIVGKVGEHTYFAPK